MSGSGFDADELNALPVDGESHVLAGELPDELQRGPQPVDAGADLSALGFRDVVVAAVNADDPVGLGHGSNSTGAGPALTVHAACGKSWKQRGDRTGHCSGCHQTFEGGTLFDLHRRGGVCANPKEMTVAGKPLRYDDTHGDGSWWSDTSHLKAAYERTESAEGTPGAGGAVEAATRRAREATEVVP